MLKYRAAPGRGESHIPRDTVRLLAAFLHGEGEVTTPVLSCRRVLLCPPTPVGMSPILDGAGKTLSAPHQEPRSSSCAAFLLPTTLRSRGCARILPVALCWGRRGFEGLSSFFLCFGWLRELLVGVQQGEEAAGASG